MEEILYMVMMFQKIVYGDLEGISNKDSLYFWMVHATAMVFDGIFRSFILNGFYSYTMSHVICFKSRGNQEMVFKSFLAACFQIH
ncbi:hypothetical protein P8452_17375 [Trifolium repens]|nr:hypothetical protein P8452_17375 [Trifolium repens]